MMVDELHEPKTRGYKLHLLVTFVMLMVLVGVALYANAWKEERRVAQVLVENNAILSTKEVQALAGVRIDSKMFDVDLFAIEQRVKRNPFVKSVGVHRDLPNRIRIDVTEREPVAAIIGEEMYYVDAEGIVLPPARSHRIFDLPVLTGSLAAGLTIGKNVESPRLRQALAFLALAQEVNNELYRNISEVRFGADGELLFFTAEFGIPVIVGNENLGRKLVTFEGFWREIVAREGAHRLQYIDLRFQDKVVVRWAAAS